MYLSMNSNTLVDTAMRKKPGTLAYELAVSLYDEMKDLSDENETLENDAENASNGLIDVTSEAVYRIEQVEDRLQQAIDVDDFRMENIKSAMELLNDAVIYFNKIGDC